MLLDWTVSAESSRGNVLLLFVMCSIWAGNFFVIKDSISYLNPILFAFFRSIGGGALLTAVGWRELRSIRRHDFGFLVLIAIFQVSIFYMCANLGLQTVSSSVAATLVYTQPVLVVAFSPLVGERFTPFKIIGIIAAFAGIGTIFLPDLEKSGLAIGDAFELAAAVSWMISILIYKKWRHGLSHYTVPGVQNLIGAAFILPFLSLGGNYFTLSSGFLVDFAYITILGSGIAYAIYFRALSKMPASVFASYLFLVPTLTTFYESVFTLTLPGVLQVAGTFLVSAGIVLVNRGRRSLPAAAVSPQG